MSNCETFECYLEEIRRRQRESRNNRRQLDGIVVPRNGNIDIETNPNMRVVFPIILVVGVFVVCMIGFLIYRFGAKYLRKQWSIWRQRTTSNSGNTQNQSRRSNSQDVNTIVDASFRDRPPSYRIVLASIQRDESPPSYETVIRGGVVNESFQNDERSNYNTDTFGRTYEDVTQNVIPNNNITTTHSSYPILDAPSQGNGTTNVSSEPRNENHQRRNQAVAISVQTINQPSRRVDIPPSPALPRQNLPGQTQYQSSLPGRESALSTNQLSTVAVEDAIDHVNGTSRFQLPRSKSDLRPNNHILIGRVRRSETSAQRNKNFVNEILTV